MQLVASALERSLALDICDHGPRVPYVSALAIARQGDVVIRFGVIDRRVPTQTGARVSTVGVDGGQEGEGRED